MNEDDEIARIEATLAAMRADDIEASADIAAVLLALPESREPILAQSPPFERAVLMAVLAATDRLLAHPELEALRFDLELRAEVALSTSEAAMRKLRG